MALELKSSFKSFLFLFASCVCWAQRGRQRRLLQHYSALPLLAEAAASLAIMPTFPSHKQIAASIANSFGRSSQV
jgi:hypothetical protein